MTRTTALFFHFSSVLLIFISFLFPSVNLAYAQAQDNKLDVTVSPVFFDFKTAPGSTIKDKIRLRNNSTSPVNLKIDIKKLTASDVRDADIVDPKPDDQFVNWIKFDTTNFEAKSREWIDLPFTIAVPQDASFGYYFTFNMTEDVAKNNPDKPTAVILGSVAVPVLLNVVSPNAKAEAEIVDFKPQQFFNEYLPVDFQVKVKNVGNVHLRPRGNIFIRGGGDKDLAILEVNERQGNILPQGSRTFDSAWMDGFIVKEKYDEGGQTKERIKINWNKLTSFRVGPYTANLLMVYDNGTKDMTLEASTTFWVLPYTAIAIMLVTLIVLFFGIRFILKSYVQSQIKKSRR